jgi:8-oxo-dGTP pyrophosphatase MutT (NUDIX family)
MPTVSAAQERLMQAAAHTPGGYGGVSQSVGKEFVGTDDAPRAAGVVFISPEGRVLLMQRDPEEKNYGGHWGLPGGKAEGGETPEEAARREVKEETGYDHGGDLTVLDRVTTPTGMVFTTFAAPVGEEFAPAMADGEHTGFTWANLDHLPGPLHPNVEKVLGSLKEMADASGQARDRAAPLALDRDSIRRVDQDGHLFVEATPISKANVCPYFGREITGWQALGLDPDRVYQLLRDPEELKKGAASFAGKPLLMEHTPVSADEHPKDVVVGAIGDDVRFEPPYVMAPLTVWDGDAIKAIETGAQRQLSSGYRYRAEMTPGTYQGAPYDGVMRDIIGNHVALVREGRAGADVMVGDEKPTTGNAGARAIFGGNLSHQEFSMAKILLSRKAAMTQGALLAYLSPKLAQDAKVDLSPVLSGVNSKNFKAKKASIVDGLKKAIDGKLAQDADIDDVVQLIDALADAPVEEGADEDTPAGQPLKIDTDPDAAATDDDPTGAVKSFLAGKLDDADMAKVAELLSAMSTPAASDEDPDDKDKDEDSVSKTAMDAAIRAAVTAAEKRVVRQQAAIRDAEKFVRPWVGELAMAHDSAEAVLRTALTTLGVDVANVHPDALKPILEAQPVPGAAPRRKESAFAQDAKSVDEYNKRFPDANRLKR